MFTDNQLPFVATCLFVKVVLLTKYISLIDDLRLYHLLYDVLQCDQPYRLVEGIPFPLVVDTMDERHMTFVPYV